MYSTSQVHRQRLRVDEAHRDQQTYMKRHGESMVLLLRHVNNAVKYVVVLVVFVVCITRTFPGDPGVLPAYYLISSLLLAALVKILKRIFKQPRPDPDQCAYHHPKKFDPNYTRGPTDIVVSGGFSDGTGRGGTNSSEGENKSNNSNNNVGADTETTDECNNSNNDEVDDDDDHGMPSSHSALLGYFSWTGVFALFSHDAFGLLSRAMGGLVGVLLPLMQLIFDGSTLLGLLTQRQESHFENLAGGGLHQRSSESLSFLLIVVMLSVTLVVLGVFGASLRVFNGDHTWQQAMVGYLLGFAWSCASVVLENKVFLVNEQTLGVQSVWMGTAIVLGLIGGYLILVVKAKKKKALMNKRSA